MSRAAGRFSARRRRLAFAGEHCAGKEPETASFPVSWPGFFLVMERRAGVRRGRTAMKIIRRGILRSAYKKSDITDWISDAGVNVSKTHIGLSKHLRSGVEHLAVHKLSPAGTAFAAAAGIVNDNAVFSSACRMVSAAHARKLRPSVSVMVYRISELTFLGHPANKVSSSGMTSWRMDRRGMPRPSSALRTKRYITEERCKVPFFSYGDFLIWLTWGSSALLRDTA